MKWARVVPNPKFCSPKTSNGVYSYDQHQYYMLSVGIQWNDSAKQSCVDGLWYHQWHELPNTLGIIAKSV